jgi:radical SAM superfamily enzyme
VQLIIFNSLAYGEDKFLIVLNNTHKKSAITFSEKIKKSLMDSYFKCDSMDINITSSFGIYCTEDDKADAGNIITEVKKKLHEAKIRSRNKSSIEKYVKVDDYKLSVLNSRIQDMRDVLNEMCITSDEIEVDNPKLKTSQHLDELIVEYMKNTNW